MQWQQTMPRRWLLSHRWLSGSRESRSLTSPKLRNGVLSSSSRKWMLVVKSWRSGDVHNFACSMRQRLVPMRANWLLWDWLSNGWSTERRSSTCIREWLSWCLDDWAWCSYGSKGDPQLEHWNTIRKDFQLHRVRHLHSCFTSNRTMLPLEEGVVTCGCCIRKHGKKSPPGGGHAWVRKELDLKKSVCVCVCVCVCERIFLDFMATKKETQELGIKTNGVIWHLETTCGCHCLVATHRLFKSFLMGAINVLWKSLNSPSDIIKNIHK